MTLAFQDADNFRRNLVTVSCGAWPSAKETLLRRVSQSDVLPIEYADLAAHLSIDDLSEQESTVRLYAGLASDFMLSRCGLSPMQVRLRLTLNEWWYQPLFVFAAPLRTTPVVTYQPDNGGGVPPAWTTLAGAFRFGDYADQWSADPLESADFPALYALSESIRVEFDIGYDTAETDEGDFGPLLIPRNVLSAWVMLTAHYYEHRELFAADKAAQVEMSAGSILQSLRRYW